VVEDQNPTVTRRIGYDDLHLVVTYIRVWTAMQGKSGLGIEAQRDAIACGGAWHDSTMRNLLGRRICPPGGRRNGLAMLEIRKRRR
jgi:hypothetical protein